MQDGRACLWADFPGYSQLYTQLTPNSSSPDLLYRGYVAARKGGEATSYLETLVRDDEAPAPVVSVLDGHSHALGFLGSALGTLQLPLGVDDFGQSGTRAALWLDRFKVLDECLRCFGTVFYPPGRG